METKNGNGHQKPKSSKALGHDPFADMMDFGDDLDSNANNGIFAAPVESSSNDDSVETTSSAPSTMLFMATSNPKENEGKNDTVASSDLAPHLVESELGEMPQVEQETSHLPWSTEASSHPEEATSIPGLSIDSATTASNSETHTEDVHDFLNSLVATIDGEIEHMLGSDLATDLERDAHLDRSADVKQHVIFTLADTEYAVPIGNVIEITQPPMTTTVPNVPHWVIGVTNLRGDILSVVDLRGFLGLDHTHITSANRMLVALINQGGETLSIGLVVDKVNEIRYLNQARIHDPTTSIDSQLTPYLEGIYEYETRLFSILNLEQLLLSTKMQQV